MSEVQKEQEAKVEVNETVVETSTQNNTGEYIAESKKYRQRAQTAEAELKELKDNVLKQEQKTLEEQNEYKELYETLKSENDKLKPKVEMFEVQEKQRREFLLSQLSEEDQEIYNELPTNKLEKHIERLGKNKVQIKDAKEVTTSGKWASATKFGDLSKEDRDEVRKNPTLWKQFVEGYKS